MYQGCLFGTVIVVGQREWVYEKRIEENEALGVCRYKYEPIVKFSTRKGNKVMQPEGSLGI